MKRLFELVFLDKTIFRECFKTYASIILIGFMIISLTPMKNILYSPLNFYSLVPYIMLILIFMTLGKIFFYKVDRIIFTGKYSRAEIIFSKLFSIILDCIGIFIIYLIINIVSQVLAGAEVKVFSDKGLKDLLYLILLSIHLASVILLITLATSNEKVASIIIYLLYFDITSTLLNMAANSNNINGYVKKFIINNPIYSLNEMFRSGQYSFYPILIIIISTILAISVDLYLLKKKEL